MKRKKTIGAILLSLFPAALLIAGFGYLLATVQTAKPSKASPRGKDLKVTGALNASTGMMRVTAIEPA